MAGGRPQRGREQQPERLVELDIAASLARADADGAGGGDLGTRSRRWRQRQGGGGGVGPQAGGAFGSGTLDGLGHPHLVDSQVGPGTQGFAADPMLRAVGLQLIPC